MLSVFASWAEPFLSCANREFAWRPWPTANATALSSRIRNLLGGFFLANQGRAWRRRPAVNATALSSRIRNLLGGFFLANQGRAWRGFAFRGPAVCSGGACGVQRDAVRWSAWEVRGGHGPGRLRRTVPQRVPAALCRWQRKDRAAAKSASAPFPTSPLRRLRKRYGSNSKAAP
jgi:hypothetical protein